MTKHAQCTFIFLKKIISENGDKIKKCYLLKSTQVLLEPNSKVNIEKRQQASPMIQNKCRWSTNEIALLKRLDNDLNDNYAKITEYFPKHTVKSITNKLNELHSKKR